MNKKKIIIVFVIILAIFMFMFMSSCLYIELRIKEICENALQKFPESKDKIDALILVIQKEENCTQEKINTLWALGQLGDEKALPFLYENQGEIIEIKGWLDIRDKIPPEKRCDFETQFAIQKIENEDFNIPAFLWREIVST
jgi:hypothetical protein